MKTKIYTVGLLIAFFLTAFSQDRTVVTATNTEISDNLDLTAVASIFGDSENLEDFERRLNDPKLKISNLDLNNDRQVDYLRIIESVESNTHLIIIQSILERDVYQDVATIEVERDRNNNLQVQVVGNVYMYGHNYIYEPIYVQNPLVYNSFWMTNYSPYCSSWYYNYYPTYFYAWTPIPIFRYRNHIHHQINIQNYYNYVNVRRSDRAVALYSSRRSNGYERQFPTRSFAQRNSNISNRYELSQIRNVQNGTPRNSLASNTRSHSNLAHSNNFTPANLSKSNMIVQNNLAVTNSGSRNELSTPRTNSTAVTSIPRENSNIRNQSSIPRSLNVSPSSTPTYNANIKSEPAYINTRTSATSTRNFSNAPSNNRNGSANVNHYNRKFSPRITQPMESTTQRNGQTPNVASRAHTSQRHSSRS